MLVDKTMDGGCPSPVFMCQNEMQRISQTLNTNVFVTSLSRPVLLKHIFCLIPPNSTGFHRQQWCCYYIFLPLHLGSVYFVGNLGSVTF